MSRHADEGTFAAFAFSKLGELRDRVRASPEFRAWLGSHETVMVDGEHFYLTGGDRLVEEEEMQLDWARGRQLIDETTIQRLQAQYQPGGGEVST